MKMKTKALLIIGFCVLSLYAFAQTTFERIIPIEGGCVELPGPECVVAGDDGIIVNVPLGIWNTIQYDNRILKISTDGAVIDELNYNVAGEKVVHYWQIVRLPVGGGSQNHYMAVGGLCDPHDDGVNTTLTDILFLVFNEDLEVEYERIENVSEIAEHYATLGRPRVVFDNDGNLVIATLARVNGGEFKRLYTHVELDKVDWLREITNYVRESPENVGWIWDFFPLSDGTYRQVEEVSGPGGVGYSISPDFEEEKILEFRDIRFQRENLSITPNLLDCGGHVLLDDSTLFIPAPMNGHIGTSATYGIGTMEMSTDFDTIKAVFQDFHDLDTTERIFSRHPVILRGEDLYMCYTRDMRTWHPSQAPYTILCKYDTNLNLIWKRWYRDPERRFCYYATDMVATSDDGILITGYCCKREEYGDMKLYLLKVDTDGLLSLPEAEDQVRPYDYYPNPVKAQLLMQFSPDVQPAQIELYDLQGRLVRTQSKAFESIDMSQLPAGTYTMRVIMEDGKAYSDKVVKE